MIVGTLLRFINYEAPTDILPFDLKVVMRLLYMSKQSALYVCGAALALCALFLFADLSSFPIKMWDESRLAVNAIEMFLSGPGLVTTYEFQPDLINTKPPLLIWLMVGSMKMFSPSEWALRLPSALAAVGTLAVIMIFAWRLTRSILAVLMTCVLLVASQGFFGLHVAATGDYDSLLTFLTTSYLCILFFVLHRRQPSATRLLIAGTLVAAAVLTKGIAGVIPGLGVVFYLVGVRRWTRPFLSPWYMACAVIVLAVAATFYITREIAQAGYLSAVVENELTGRYVNALEDNSGPVWFYVRLILRQTFSAGSLLLLLPIGLIAAKDRVRLGILFGCCIVSGLLVVFSFSATKLPWYAAPAYPFLALALALSVWALVERIGLSGNRGLVALGAHAAILIISIAITAKALIYRYHAMPGEILYRPQASYGTLFGELYRQGIHKVTVLDAGEDYPWNAEARYAPRLRFYTLMWQTRQFNVQEIAPDFASLAGSSGKIVATCDPRQIHNLLSHGKQVVAIAGCAAVTL
jgi:4-amino-4-deoxy-L-arabinose transferase-like glycosyltransferase